MPENQPSTTAVRPFYQRYRWPIFIAIMLLAAAGRIINLDAESLWVDEGFSYWAIRHDDMFNLLLQDVHPPLYFYGLQAWVSLTGISELALRFFSVLPSLLSVAVITQVARELVWKRDYQFESPVPLLAALMLALADMENYIAQETRMYTWHVLWALVSMWFFLRWVRLATYDGPVKQERFAFVAWIIASLLLVYTHYVGAALLGVQFVYAVLFLRYRARWQTLAGLVFIGVLFVPWLLVVVSGQTENVGTGFNVPSTLESLWNWRVDWFTGQWPLNVLLALFGLVTVVYISEKTSARARAAAVGSVERIHVSISAGFLLLLWIIVPVAGAYVLNLYTPILMDYRLTQITPAIALLVAFGLNNLRGAAFGIVLAALVIYGVTTDDTPRPRPPWREVGQDAALFAQPGDLALAHVTPSGDWQVLYYYERFMPEGVERRSLRQWKREDPDSYPTGFPALLDAHEHVWFMHWSSEMDGFEALDAAGYVQTAVLTEDWLGNDLTVYRYDRLPDEALTAYESGMVLRDSAVINDSLRVDLWWSVPEAVPVSYTVSAFLLDENGVLVAQDDAQPFMNQRPTNIWAPGEVVYDPHVLQLREDLMELPPGQYTVGVKVYQWTPEGLIDQPTVDGEDFAVVGRLAR